MRSISLDGLPPGLFAARRGDVDMVASHAQLTHDERSWSPEVGCAMAGCSSLGVLFSLFAVALTWLFDAPVRMNDEELSKPLATLFLVGFAVLWVAVAWWVLGGFARVQAIQSGAIPQHGWRLALGRDRWRATRYEMWRPRRTSIDPLTVRGVEVDDQQRVTARTSAGISVLTGPLEPAAAQWLAAWLGEHVARP